MAEAAVEARYVKEPAWKIRLGKAIFWSTVAFAVWFFYWFNAIQCPCWCPWFCQNPVCPKWMSIP